LLGSTQLVSGSIANLQSDDGNYMTFSSYSSYDFQSAESLGESSWSANTEYQDKVVLTFTPATAADYIVIATAEVQGNCVSPPDVKARLYNGTSTWQELIYKVKDITDWYPFSALKRVYLSASSQTLKIQYGLSETTSTAKIRNARLYAFSLSSQYTESEAESSWNTNTNWQDKVALTFTPSTSGDYLIIATANLGGSSTTYSTLVQFLRDGVVQAGPTRETSASEARYTFGVMRKVNLDTTSHTFKIQYRTENTANTAYISHAHIVAIRVDQFSNNYYAESEGESGPTYSNTWYDKVTNTYTAQAADHLIIGSILYKAGSTYSSVGLRLVQGADVDQSPLVEHKDSTDYEGCFMMAKASLSAGSVTDKIQYKGESTYARVKNARLISLQLPIQHAVEVEFTGSSNTDDWTQLNWVVDSAWTTPSVTVTLQLYNYNLGQYPTSGDGYISYTSSATSNTDETKTQTITSNPTYFRDTSGNWKVKVKGVKSTTTQFNLKADLVKYETITQENTPPTAYDQTVSTEEDTPKNITLTASDPDDDPLTYSIVTGSTHGILSGSPPNVTYTPDLNYNGADSFTFKAYDGQAYSNIATVSITVTPVNDPPTAPVVDVTPNLPLTTDDLVCTVTTLSTDPDGDTITYFYEWYKNGILQSDETTVTTALTDTVSSTKTAKGEVWKCVVTPYDGTVNGTSAQDQVTIGNSPPSIEGVDITPDPAYTDDTLTATPYGWSDADGDPEGYTYQWQKWNGASWQDISGETSNTLGPDNFVKGDQIKIICTPFDGEDYGASKEDTITISNSPPSAPVVDVIPDFPVTTDDLVCIIVTPSVDPDGDTVTYTYEWYKNGVLQPEYTTNTVPANATTFGDVWKCVVTPHGSDGPPDSDEVTIGNSPPVLVPIGPKSVNEQTLLSFTALAVDHDVPPQTLTFSLGPGAPSGASITSGGAFTWTPTEAQGPGVYNINITVSDGIAMDYEVIAVTVYEVNQPPVLNAIGSKSVNELSMLSFTATASDVDIPVQTLTFSFGSGAPSGASITSGGYFTWTPTEAQGPGVYSINITVSDGLAIDYEVISVTVYEVNVAPVLNPIGPKSINELSTLSFTATATDSDTPAQTLTFSLGAGAPSGASITSGGYFTWIPTETQGPGVYNINVTVSDGIAIDYEVITVTVNEVNLAPILDPIGAKIVNELSLLTFTATASDPDIPAQTLTFSLGSGAPTGASINPTTGVFTWTPTEAQGPGVYTIRVIVSDGSLTDYEDISVTVNEVNVAPVLNPIGSKSIDELSTLSFTATATDSDLPAQTLVFSLGSGAPSGASITSAGVFSWTPTEAQGPGSFVVRIIVSDGSLTDYEDVTITVNEVNLPPVLSPIGSKTVYAGSLLQFTITASDPDIPAQTLAYLASNLPSGATFNPTTRVFSWQPTSGQVGVYSGIHFEVSDGLLTDSEDITITVKSSGQGGPGGYSVSLKKQAPMFNLATYTILIVLFGAVLSLMKRKRK
jgi:hypothetical protein